MLNKLIIQPTDYKTRKALDLSLGEEHPSASPRLHLALDLLRDPSVLVYSTGRGVPHDSALAGLRILEYTKQAQGGWPVAGKRT